MQFGKDFDAIKGLIAQKHSKRGAETDAATKSKEQIRHLYYRTLHKISSHIDKPNVEGEPGEPQCGDCTINL